MRPDYCPIGGEPCQSLCDTPCTRTPHRTEQEPVAWKLVPTKPTEEMLKAMDECSTEGYDERLYAGHAASVYMAAWDKAPTPPQRKPLTDADVERIVRESRVGEHGIGYTIARAIEAAHGITGEKK